MLLSKYFFKTIKENPREAEFKSHILLLRGGYIKQVSAGIFSYMPIAVRALKKIEAIIREEMDAVDGFEVNLPVAMPASLWSETGRYEAVGDELLRFNDRVGRKMLLGMTHEEAVTDLARFCINSYKQLPVMVYQLQTKFRDEPRVRGGLIRVREFVMKDAYSFHTSNEDLDKYYNRVHTAYENIFRRSGLSAISVASDVGMMGGNAAHEFMAVAESGEDTLILCHTCGYKANREVAKAKRHSMSEEMKPREEIHTPSKETIGEVAAFLNVDERRMLKTVAFKDEDDNIILAMIRGDLEINEIKLKNYLKKKILNLATDEDLGKKSIVKGFIGPVGIDKSITIVVDESILNSNNLVAGANKKDYHIKNINYRRDFVSEYITDISLVKQGDKCPICGDRLSVTRGIEVGNIFKLGTKYSSSMKARFLDESGKEKDIIMGCYGIGVGRLLASVIEVQASEKSIVWPITIAPFEVELIGLFNDKNSEIERIANDLYKDLTDANISVLYDDRKASPGFKFNDAALIGSPIKVAIGQKSIDNGGVELFIKDSEAVICPIGETKEKILKAREDLFKELK